MDWEQLRERTLGEVSTALITQGAGVAGGFVGAAFVGRQVQNLVKKDADIATMTDKVMAWTANNVPKIAIWYLARGYALEPGETVTPMKEAISDARKAMAGSVVFDTLMRLANGGINPASATLWNWQVLDNKGQKSVQADTQRLIQENSALRAELNKALQRLATQPASLPAAPTPAMSPVQTVQHRAAQMTQRQAPVQITQMPAPAPVQATPVQVTPVYAAPVQATPVQVAPVYAAQQRAPVQTVQQPVPPPPIVRYTPMAERSAKPVVRLGQAAQPRPPMIRAEQMQEPPPVAERERRYGFMREVTPPAVQERERRFGFMAGGEKDIAAVFGML